MNYLLDTHIFLWGSYDQTKLSAKALNAIESSENELFLSSGSIWEIAIKAKLGKLKVPKNLDKYIGEQMRLWGLKPLPIQISYSIEIKSLPDHHKDPFDRILVAQAAIEKLTIITNDSQIRKYKVNTFW